MSFGHMCRVAWEFKTGERFEGITAPHTPLYHTPHKYDSKKVFDCYYYFYIFRVLFRIGLSWRSRHVRLLQGFDDSGWLMSTSRCTSVREHITNVCRPVIVIINKSGMCQRTEHNDANELYCHDVLILRQINHLFGINEKNNYWKWKSLKLKKSALITK